jgi:hypothetical protein
LLELLKLQNLIELLLELYPEIEPDNNQLSAIWKSLNIKNCGPQMLELARRYCCDRDRVASFVMKFQ